MTSPSRCRRTPPSRSRALSSKPPCSVGLLLLVVVTLVAVTQAGALGGRNVPWWYPSRDWGGGASDGDDTGWRAGGGEDGGDDIANGWVSGSSRLRYREEASVAREFVETHVANGVAEEEERTEAFPECSIHEASNDTLKSVAASVDRCASPYYSLREIHPSQLTQWRKLLEKQKMQDVKRRRRAGRGGRGEGAALGGDNLGEPAREDSFLGIFLFIKGDYFSVELENALTAVAPAYPRAWIVKADAPSFLSFSVQYRLHTYPQVLLFKNGRYASRYRGKRSIEDLAAWLSLQTGDLPRAIPRRALPPPPPPHPFSPPGSDEPLTWAALLYAAIKIVNAIAWFVKRRRGAAREAEGAGGSRLAGYGQWLAGAFLRRGRGWGRRRVGVDGAGGRVAVVVVGGGGFSRG